MNILIVVTNYLPFIGGVEIHARQVARQLSQNGHTVSIAAGNFAPYKISPRLSLLATNLMAPSAPDSVDGSVPVHALTPRFPDRIRMLPIAIRCLPKISGFAYHPLNRFGYPFYRSVYLPRLQKLTEQADVVHSLAGNYLGWAAQESAHLAGVPFVCTPFVHPHQWGDGPEDVEYYQRADAVIGLVDTDRDYLVSLGVPEEKTHVIGVSPELPDTADPEGFRKNYGLDSQKVILYVGRMMTQKGAMALADAAPLVWNQFPETRFVFIGPDSEKKFAGCDPRILGLGRVSIQEKADALAACDIFCMPSISEILPTVYLEAWSYGKPVLGGMAHGLPELIEGNGAGLVSSQKVEELAGKLIQLLADPEKCMLYGNQGRELVISKYSVPAVTNALLSLYHNITATQKIKRRTA